MSTQLEVNIALNNIRKAFQDDTGVVGFGVTIVNNDYAIQAMIKSQARNVPDEYQGVKIIKEIIDEPVIAF